MREKLFGFDIKSRLKVVSFDFAETWNWAHKTFMSKRQIKKLLPNASILKNFDREKNVLILLFREEREKLTEEDFFITVDDKKTIEEILKEKTGFDVDTDILL